MLQIQIKLTSENARVPEKAFISEKKVRSEESAGYDLYSIEPSTTLKVGERKLFKTGLIMAIPPGYYGRIAPRSGLAYKSGIDVMAGVIDSDYRADVGVILINLNQSDVVIDTSKAIAQIIIEKHYDSEFSVVSELSSTARASGGFGSTDRQTTSESITSNLIDQYQKMQNVITKKRYSDEIREKVNI